MKAKIEKRGLRERLDADGVVCAEGFLFEIERRGYMASGAFVPEVALTNPTRSPICTAISSTPAATR